MTCQTRCERRSRRLKMYSILQHSAGRKALPVLQGIAAIGVGEASSQRVSRHQYACLDRVKCYSTTSDFFEGNVASHSRRDGGAAHETWDPYRIGGTKLNECMM